MLSYAVIRVYLQGAFVAFPSQPIEEQIMLVKCAVLVVSLLLSAVASATELHMRALPDGVVLTFTGIDSEQGIPNGALHCVTGTRQYYAGIDGTNQFDLYRMVGGCVPVGAGTANAVHRIMGAGRLCLVPILVNQQGWLIAHAYHPRGATNLATRNGNMVTAIMVGGGMVRPATPEEAYGCD